jgi:MinD superfamily P-loop ATPase
VPNNNLKELIVISGKGGVGKTSIVASFAALSDHAVFADCDVDAADLHLILQPSIQYRNDFRGGFRARIQPELCSNCGICTDLCRYGAVINDNINENHPQCTYQIDDLSCEGCGVCAYFCPETAIIMEQPINGEWYISNTRFGPMVHARLGIAEENSGKLVSLVRREARRIAEGNHHHLIIVDGAPGIGCPVIASLTGSNLVLIVTEPTVSGIHDMRRVGELTHHFHIPALVCINKWDVNPDMSQSITATAEANQMTVVGRISYDDTITQAQVAGVSVIEFADNSVSKEIRCLWSRVQAILST